MGKKSSDKTEDKSVKSDFVPIQIKVSKELRTKFKTYCVSNDTNMTDVLTEMINKVVNKNGKEY